MAASGEGDVLNDRSSVADDLSSNRSRGMCAPMRTRTNQRPEPPGPTPLVYKPRERRPTNTSGRGMCAAIGPRQSIIRSKSDATNEAATVIAEASAKSVPRTMAQRAGDAARARAKAAAAASFVSRGSAAESSEVQTPAAPEVKKLGRFVPRGVRGPRAPPSVENPAGSKDPTVRPAPERAFPPISSCRQPEVQRQSQNNADVHTLGHPRVGSPPGRSTYERVERPKSPVEGGNAEIISPDHRSRLHLSAGHQTKRLQIGSAESKQLAAGRNRKDRAEGDKTPSPKSSPSGSRSSLEHADKLTALVSPVKMRRASRLHDERTESAPPSLLRQASKLRRSSAITPKVPDSSGVQGKRPSSPTESKPGPPANPVIASLLEQFRSQQENRDREAEEFAKKLSNEFKSVEKGRESWTSFIARASERIRKKGIPDRPNELFETFRTATNVDLIFATFACLFRHASCPDISTGRRATRRGSGVLAGIGSEPAAPWANPSEVIGRRWTFPFEAIRVEMAGNWKAKKLWDLLDKRRNRPEYAHSPCSDGPLLGRRVVVVGAGPCGLRAAIELRLLGAHVSVVERRTKFERINQLHIWSWCGEDFKGLGARVLEPPPSDFGSNPDILHISIADAQLLLLKVALLLGVEVLMGVDFLGTEWNSSCRDWTVRLGQPFSGGGPTSEGRAGEDVRQVAPQDSELPSPKFPSCLSKVAVVIVANGFGSVIGEDHGIDAEETQSSRADSAIGVIVNFARVNGEKERKLRSFSMAKQFYVSLFNQAAEATGADLENIVYTKGQHSHYFVMTPVIRSLLACGVVRERGKKPLLSGDNLDTAKLDEFVRRITSYEFKAGQQPVLSAAQEDAHGKTVPYADSGPRLFDFSRMRRHLQSMIFVDPPAGSQEDGQGCKQMLVTVVGDALVEPFWPEGLGIVRGFFGVLDACAGVGSWASGHSCEEVHSMVQRSYTELKTLAAATRKKVLRDDESRFGLLPESRYRRLPHGFSKLGPNC